MGITPPPRRPHNPLDLPVVLARAPHGDSDAVRGVRRRGFLALLLTLVLAAGLVPTAPLQAFGDPQSQGTDGGCTWTYNDVNKQLTIAPAPNGDGRLRESRTGINRGWLNNASGATSIVVENGVTASGNMGELFMGMAAATSITLPDGFDKGITNARGLFQMCSSLETLLLPAGFGGSITDASGMFSTCSSLKNLTLPDDFGGSINNANSMFADCSALESLTLPDGFGVALTSSDDMLSSCSHLVRVDLGENCNGVVLTRVPAAAEGDYLGTWVRLVDDPDVTYDKGKAPSDLQADYEDAEKPKSVYVRQHVALTVPDKPQAGTSVKADAIYITISVSAPVDVFVFYSLDGANWQQEPPSFSGLSPYTAYDKIQVRYSSPAYKNASTTTLSATTLGLITYKSNGGSGTTKPTEGIQFASSALAAECTFEHAPSPSTQYKFKEWNTSPDGTGTSYHPGDPVPFKEGGDTLYAIWKEYQPPVITTADLPTAKTGELYSQKLTASGTEPVAWSVSSGELPAGLTLSSDGVISGTPSAKGAFPFTVKAVNEYHDPATADFSITVVGPPVITSSSLPDATAGSPYRQELSATGYPETFTWTLKPGSTLPEGLSLSANGIISGTPRATGTATFTVQVANGFAPDAAKEFSLKVNDRKTPVALVATGDNVAGPTAGLVTLLLFCAASITVLSLRLRTRRR